MSCKHTYLQLTPSPFAQLAGYEQPDAQARLAAETKSGKSSKSSVDKPIHLFPGPLVVPHDGLNYDPDCPPQSFKSWLSMKSRNKMTNKTRDTIYLARVPNISQEVDFMREWTSPRLDRSPANNITSPNVDLFVDYLKAFYHGMNVQALPAQISWNSWDKTNRPNRRVNLPKHVGLTYDDQCTRIRVRSVPDNTFTAQLNLDDILDAAIAMLPTNAYALLLLVDHDIYENEDDDFCCGRAYGGSRVAVVQTARYNPVLDVREGIDRAHMWPMSHCKGFVDGLCKVEDVLATKPTKEQVMWSTKGAMRTAVDAGNGFIASSDEEQETQALWFSRLARTVSHELGHCFGIGHCVYYACNMQGTAGMKEDVRQPPYLCPVCEAKVGHAIAGELHGANDENKALWVRQRCEALRDFCKTLDNQGMTSAMWRGREGWLVERMKSM